MSTPSSTPTLYSYGVASIARQQSVRLTGLMIKSVMTGSWTVSLRVRLRGRSNGGALLTMDNDFLYLREGDPASATTPPTNTIKAVFSNNQVVSSQCELELGRWYTIAMTVSTVKDSHGNVNAADIMLFVDGSPFGSTDPATNQPKPVRVSYTDRSSDSDHPFLGNGVDAEFGSVTFWRGVLGETDIIQNAHQAPVSSGLIYSYDFSTPTHTVDTKQITLANGAQLACVNTGVAFGGGVAIPDPADGLNPGGDLSKPFTVHAWVYPTVPTDPTAAHSLLAILSNGSSQARQTFAFGLKYAPSSRTFTLAVKVQQVPLPVEDTMPLQPGVWNEVGITWDGQALRFYVDGKLSSTVELLFPFEPLGESNLTIGAIAAATSTGGYAAFFYGHLQSLSIWDRALTAAQIEELQAPRDPSLEDPLAFYDLTTLDLFNHVTGRPLAFKGTAQVTDTVDVNFADAPDRNESPPNNPEDPTYYNLAALQADNAKISGSEVASAVAPGGSPSTAAVALLDANLEYYVTFIAAQILLNITAMAFQLDIMCKACGSSAPA